MQPRIELYISGYTYDSNQPIGGMVDLHGDEEINLTYAVANVRNVSEKKSSYSQSFICPGSKSNNLLFKNIFEIGIDSQYDPRKKALAWLYVDSQMVMEGVLQLTKIDLDDEHKVQYEVVLYGTNADLFEKIDGKFLTDLNWSGLNHTFNYTNIVNSWQTNGDYYYPLIDYGNGFSLADLQGNGVNSGRGVMPEQLYPAIKEKFIFDCILSAAGYSYNNNNSLPDVSNWEYMYVPYNSTEDLAQSDLFVTNRQFRSQITSGYTITPISISQNNFYTPNYDDDSTPPNFDNGGLFDTSTYKYSGDVYSYQSFSTQLEIGFSGLVCNTYIIYHRSTITTPSNWLGFGANVCWVTHFPGFNSQGAGVNNLVHYTGNPLNHNTYFMQDTTPIWNGNPANPTLYPVQPGEQIWANYLFVISSAYTTPGIFSVYSANTFFENTVYPNRVVGGNIDYNFFVPGNVRQTDFIKSVMTRFNLYMEPDKNYQNNLVLRSRDQYYSSGTIKDWTSKLDVSQRIEKQLLSEQQSRILRFKYKEDNDYLNDHYQTSKNRTYGDYINEFDNDFVVGETAVEVIQSPTPLWSVDGSEFIIPRIGKRDANGAWSQTNFNMRSLQINENKVVKLNTQIFKFSGQTFDYYPYMGHLNHGLTGNTDLNFGQVQYMYYPLDTLTPNDLIGTYWQNYLAEINDKDSYLLTAYFYLTPADIALLKLNDSIYVEGITRDGGAYYKINQVEYSPTSNRPSRVELIKSLNQFVPPRLRFTGITTTFPNIHLTNLRNSIVIGNGVNYSNRSILAGTDNGISSNSPNTFVNGTNNRIGSYAPGNTILGGTNNIIEGGTGNTILGGTGIIITGGTDTTYVQNLTVTSAITIGTTVITASGITALNLWSAGTGSKSIISSNSNNSSSGSYSLVTGYANFNTGTCSTVIGGYSNVNNSQFASILGGQFNTAQTTLPVTIYDVSTSCMSVIGGKSNYASGAYSSVLGGNNNFAKGKFSSVIGGMSNTVKTSGSTVVGGYSNYTNQACNSTVIGGKGNSFTVINSGQEFNSAYSTIVGGTFNFVSSGISSSVVGGSGNIVGHSGLTYASPYSVISGGKNNWVAGRATSIMGGAGNQVAGNYSAVVGGILNTARTTNIGVGMYSAIMGGSQNVTSSRRTFMGAGALNTISNNSDYSSIVGGIYHMIGGLGNGDRSTIFGGASGSIASSFGSIIGGNSNSISTNSPYSAIFGGSGNSISAKFSSIISATGVTATKDFTVHVPNILIQKSHLIYWGTANTYTNDATAGLATLVGGTATVNTSKVTAGSYIFLTNQKNGGTVGALYISARTAGTSFTITSTSGTDTSLVAWFIVEPT